MSDQAPVPKLVAAYMRVSTEEQSIERQRQLIAEWSAANGVTVGRWYDEGDASGGLSEDDRPQLAAMMAAVAAGEVGRVVVTEWSRLGRVADEMLHRAMTLWRAKAETTVLNDPSVYDLDDPMEMMFLFMTFVQDHKFRRDLKRVTKSSFVVGPDGLKRSRRNGKRCGGVPAELSPEKKAEVLRRRAKTPPDSFREICADGLVGVRRTGLYRIGESAKAGGRPVSWEEREVKVGEDALEGMVARWAREDAAAAEQSAQGSAA